MPSLVALAMAQLDEEPVGLARMHPGDVRARAVDLGTVGAELPHRAGNVGALEADEIDTLPAPLQEATDGLRRIGRLEELDVADAGREDGVAEPEALGVAPAVNLEVEQAREARGGRVQVSHHDGQLDDVTQHDVSSHGTSVKRPSWLGEIEPRAARERPPRHRGDTATPRGGSARNGRADARDARPGTGPRA